MKKLSLLLVAMMCEGSALCAWSADPARVGFTIQMMDSQFFTTPYEHASVLGGAYMGLDGCADAVIKNPAALGALKTPEALGYGAFNTYQGDGGANGPTSSENITAKLADGGGYGAMPLAGLPLILGMGADYFSTDFSEAPITAPVQRGYRVSGALAGKVSERSFWGYGLTYLDDHHAWGTVWPIPPRGVVPVHVEQAAESWRHRLAFQHQIPDLMTWGLQGSFGHGKGDNTWNGKPATGDNALRDYGLRVGGKSVPVHSFALLADMEWRNTDVELGHHDPVVGQPAVPARYAGNLYRLMLGLEQNMTDWLQIQYGYRYSIFRMDDFCYRGGDADYHTVAGGLGLSFLKDRLHVNYSAEYSWIAGDSLANTISVRYSF